METTQVHQHFIQRICDIAGLEEKPDPQHELEKDLGLDSFMMCEIVEIAEREFGIAISGNKQELKTFQQLLDCLSPNSKTQEAQGSWIESIYQPPDVPLENFIQLRWSKWHRFLFRIARFFLRTTFKFLHKIEFQNIEKLPPTGPYLICPNHQSYPDPLFLYAMLPEHIVEQLVFIGYGAYFKNPPLSWVNRFGRVLLTRGPDGRPECLNLAHDALRRGMIVCVFPEGGRSTDGNLMKPRLGAGLLSHETQLPIYPVRIDGALESLSFLSRGLHFCRITLTAGDPVYPRSTVGAAGEYNNLMERWTQSVMKIGENKHRR